MAQLGFKQHAKLEYNIIYAVNSSARQLHHVLNRAYRAASERSDKAFVSSDSFYSLEHYLALFL